MTICEQMLSVLLQFPQDPVVVHGVAIEKRFAFIGAAMVRAREIASATFAVILFAPQATMT